MTSGATVLPTKATTSSVSTATGFFLCQPQSADLKARPWLDKYAVRQDEMGGRSGVMSQWLTEHEFE